MSLVESNIATVWDAYNFIVPNWEKTTSSFLLESVRYEKIKIVAGRIWNQLCTEDKVIFRELLDLPIKIDYFPKETHKNNKMLIELTKGNFSISESKDGYRGDRYWFSLHITETIRVLVFQLLLKIKDYDSIISHYPMKRDSYSEKVLSDILRAQFVSALLKDKAHDTMWYFLGDIRNPEKEKLILSRALECETSHFDQTSEMLKRAQKNRSVTNEDKKKELVAISERIKIRQAIFPILLVYVPNDLSERFIELPERKRVTQGQVVTSSLRISKKQKS